MPRRWLSSKCSNDNEQMPIFEGISCNCSDSIRRNDNSRCNDNSRRSDSTRCNDSNRRSDSIRRSDSNIYYDSISCNSSNNKRNDSNRCNDSNSCNDSRLSKRSFSCRRNSSDRARELRYAAKSTRLPLHMPRGNSHLMQKESTWSSARYGSA